MCCTPERATEPRAIPNKALEVQEQEVSWFVNTRVRALIKLVKII